MFKPFHRGNPCPVCGAETNDCRFAIADPDFIQCHTFVDAKKGERVNNGYVCVKTSNGHTASFKPDNSQEWTEEQRRQWKQQVEAKRLQRAREDQIRREKALTLTERDKQYRALLDELTLTPEDAADLRRRGFTDLEIQLSGIKSVKQWQPLQKKYSSLLPGISPNGRGILCLEGYLLPVRNADGLIVAIQIRLKNVAADEGRYRWGTSRTKKNPHGQTPHVHGVGFSQLPISVHRPPGQAKGIGLTEGTHIKPYLASRRLNLIVLGASGGNFDSSPDIFHQELEKVQIWEFKEVTIFPDAGDVLNSSVMKRWRRVAELLKDWGWTVKFAWWGQVTKEADDVDELGDYSQIRYLTPEEFWEIAKTSKSTAPTQSTQTNITPLQEVQQLDWAWDNWLKSRKFTPDIKVNQEKFRIPQVPDSGVIVACKSGLGTGKTEALLEVMRTSNRGGMIIGYRNNLLFQTIDRGAQIGVNIYHLREDDGSFMLADDSSHQAFCLDSAYRVDGYFKGRDIYLDETCSVLIHAVNGGTLGDEQGKALKILTQALQSCNRVFLLDGNLTDIYVDFLAKLAPQKQVIKIENYRKIAPQKIFFVEGIDVEGEVKKRDSSALIAELSKPDVIPWIFCDSKERTKILDEILKSLGRIGYVLNSETASEDWAKEFLANPNKFIADKKPSYFIISPTAESGVSVVINDYFTHKFSIFAGVQGTNSQHQAMFRLRDNSIAHYVFCPERSTITDRATPHTYSVKKYKEILDSRILQSAFLASESANNPEKALLMIGEALARQNDEWWGFSTHLGALDTYEMDNLRKCLIHALEEAGHKVEIIQWDVDGFFQQKEKDAKVVVQLEHAKELYEAVEFESTEKALLAAKSNPRKPTQRAIEKTFLLDKLLGIKESGMWNTEFIYQTHIKNKHFITQQQRYWLVKNFAVSQKRHEAAWFYEATKEDFFSARVKKMSHDIIWALRELDILQFEGKEYHKNSPEVIELVQKLRERQDIQLALNIHVKPATATGNERLEILGTLLNLVGLRNRRNSQKLASGVKLRHYVCEPSLPGVKKLEKEAIVFDFEVATGATWRRVKVQQEEIGFDFAAAREAILQAVGRKFRAWMESDKSKVNWSEAPAVVDEVDAAVGLLQSVKSWEEVDLERTLLERAWDRLTLSEQERLNQLYQQWQRQLEAAEKAAMTTAESATVELAALLTVTETQQQPQPATKWKGLRMQLKQKLEISSSFLHSLYQQLSAKLGGVILTVDGEPWLNQFLEGKPWWVHMNHPSGCDSVPIDWLEPVPTTG